MAYLENVREDCFKMKYKKTCSYCRKLFIDESIRTVCPECTKKLRQGGMSYDEAIIYERIK